ncbi:diguanylate cyclase (GGDEF)-like protein/PAS domain S-box-containing protein [Streptacidiphilus sp. BW17]|uniref:aminotransferase class I/II-fold pyridoxal phosphate-dependent enzyme n=1 Tax=Streptacidiphilus sp. BW17 TaxID=3156274 RepID=UPI003516D155
MARLRLLVAGYLVCVAVATVCYLLEPGWHTVTWAVIGFSGVAAILVGIRLNRPSHRLPWFLLAGANFAFTAGDTTYNVLRSVTGEPNPFPSLADAFYLTTYPLFAAGLFLFIRYRAVDQRDWGSLLDALTLTSGLALLSWIYLIQPNTQASGTTWLAKAISIAYPLGDVLMLAMLARLLVAGSTRTRAVQLLTIGTVGILFSDVLYGWYQVNGAWQVGTPMDLGWVVFYTAWGLSALAPSMVGLTEPVPHRGAGIAGRRLGLLALASLIAPGMLLYEAGRGSVRDAGVIAVFSAVLFLLVLARLSGMVSSHRRAVLRERALRVSAASLVAAVSVEEIAGLVRVAAGTLLWPDSRHEALLALGDAAGLRPVRGTQTPPPRWRITRVQLLAGDWLRSLQDGRSQLVGVDELASGAGGVAGVGGDPPTALVCPLILEERPTGEALFGALVVAGPQRQLEEFRSILETLASQVALAVERIRLSKEIVRRDSEAYFRALIHNASDVILILDDDNTVRYASPSAEAMFGPGPSNEVRRLADLVHPDDAARAAGALARMRESNREQELREDWQFLRQDHSRVEMEVRCSNLRHDRTVRGLVLTLRDVTDQRKLERELTHRAFHDSLTGLPNRILLLNRIEHALAPRGRGRDRGLVSALFIDLDDFKVVNDTLGHTVGDQLLAAAARRLTGTLRAGDMAARLGGDEFAVLIEGVDAPADVDEVADHIVAALAQPFRIHGETISVSASVGIATALDSSDGEELLGHADLALYAAKAGGKRQWRRYQPTLHSGMVERQELRASLDNAIAEEEFTLLHQPIVEMASGAITGFEALARWPHARLGLVLPEHFIALAEETGQIMPLGAWILERATADAAHWQHAVPRPVPLDINVNVSARQFRDPRFVGEVRHALDRSGLAPGSLVLELTETVLMRQSDQVRADMRTLKGLGVRIAIDDFGTGFSSLGYLRDYPIDLLKVDKSFVDGLLVDEQQVALVEGIIRIARTLGMKVIAEGIEDARQQARLADMGCEFGQGFLFSPPVSAEVGEHLLRQQSESRPMATAAASGDRSAGPKATGGPRDAHPAGRGPARPDPISGRPPSAVVRPSHAKKEQDMSDLPKPVGLLRRDTRWGDLERLRQSSPMCDAVIDEVRGRQIRVGDHWLTDFASCNYLGFDLDPEIMDSIDPLVRRWGTHPSWSRLLGSPRLYPQIEERLTDLLGAPDTLVLPTITLIHASVIPAIAGVGSIFVDSAAHRTVYDGCMIARGQGATVHRCHVDDLDDLESRLRSAPAAHSRLVCIDGANSMSGNLPDLPLLARLCRLNDALLYVDDAHGFGIIGERTPDEPCPYGSRGNSIVRYFDEAYDGIILVGGFSKAYSSLLAFIALPTWLKDHLKVAAAPYLYSGPSPTASLATTLAGFDVNADRGDALRADIWRMSASVLDHLAALGVRTPNTSGLPIIEIPLRDSADLEAVASFLWDRGAYVTLAAYPLVPHDRVGFRIQITAANTDEEVERLNATLTALVERFELQPRV